MCYSATDVVAAVALAVLPGSKLATLALDVIERKLGVGGGSS